MNDNNKSDLDRLAENLEKNAEKSEQKLGMVSFTDLFTPSFMSTYTQFANFGELLTVGKFNVNSLEDFMALLNDDFDLFIKKKTKFKNWDEMQSTAVSDYFKKQEASN
ncbi:hypothetical protein [Desulfosporosinus nitroreducens]|uniref:Uncharacterized protein n=1 Tax=Desulfosporosinus nitroreducens TaxID=2018668 RepID=A0ABT8QQ35_9FIRM|nr:hypothetical protein [Desulfosporosinus nitroreducens]MCO1601913.1 hypothetical protein [Desulfosporosinus nitroreducens]MDO0823468.1 hypothetical protein [Desulfosporosinus nitroreducens]